MNKTAIFENSRLWSAAILKIALSPYLIHELSDFDQIWYPDADFHSEDVLLQQQKIETMQIQDGGRMLY